MPPAIVHQPADAAAHAAYSVPAVRAAITGAINYFDTVPTTRIGRASLLGATATLFQRLQPAGPAISAYIPPPEVPHVARLQDAGIIVLDPAQPSGFALPVHWDIIAANVLWRDVKDIAVQRWKHVGHFVRSLQVFVAALVPVVDPQLILGAAAPIPAAVGGVPAAVVQDPAILLLQQQLAQQQADHANALAAIQAQLVAQAAAHAAAIAAVPAAVPQIDPLVRPLLDELSSSELIKGNYSVESLDVLAEVLWVHARKLSTLILETGSTRFGADPLDSIRPARMPLLVHLCPELVVEDPDVLSGPRATLQLLQARVFMLRRTLGTWQQFIALVDPSHVTTDFQSLGGVPVTSAPGLPIVSTNAVATPPTPAKPELHRQAEVDIQAAVRGEPVSEEAALFQGGSSLLTRLTPVMPACGLHKGVDLRVRPVRGFAEDDAPRWEMGLDGTSRLRLNTKCKNMEEWEQAFLNIAIGCPSKEQARVLLSFHAWFKLRVSQFGFTVMLEFYDFLMKLVKEDRADMAEHRIHTVWQEFQLLKMREGVDIYYPQSQASARSPANPKGAKLQKVDPAKVTKPAAAKFKGTFCFNFNKEKGCSNAACTHPHVCKQCGGKHAVMACPQT